jgi:hypothetical protein
VGILGGTLVVLVGLWLGFRRADRTIPSELREAMRLEKSDPARSQFLADAYFQKMARQDEAERVKLWERAAHDLAAANELRQRLLDDLDADALAEKELGKRGGPQLIRTLEESRKSLREQIAKVDAIIRGVSAP